MLHVLAVRVAEVLQVEVLLLSAGPRLLEAELVLVLVLDLDLDRLGALQAGKRLVGARLVLVGLAEWVRRKPLVQRQLAGVQRDALWGAGSEVRAVLQPKCLFAHI